VLGLANGCAQRVAPSTREVSVHEYLFGAFGGAALDARDLCPGGDVSAFEIRRSASAYLVSVLSLGLYLPHQVRVRCRTAGAP
jgi:hypothetical protein